MYNPKALRSEAGISLTHSIISRHCNSKQWWVQAPMLILGKNGRRDLVVAGQKSAIVWALNPDNGTCPSFLASFKSSCWTSSRVSCGAWVRGSLSSVLAAWTHFKEGRADAHDNEEHPKAKLSLISDIGECQCRVNFGGRMRLSIDNLSSMRDVVCCGWAFVDDELLN
jgi:hypothetical protein